jgi:hypothetical protein
VWWNVAWPHVAMCSPLIGDITRAIRILGSNTEVLLVALDGAASAVCAAFRVADVGGHDRLPVQIPAARLLEQAPQDPRQRALIGFR